MYSIESGLFFFQHYLGIIQGISYYMVAFVWWVCYVLIRVEVDREILRTHATGGFWQIWKKGMLVRGEVE